MKKTLSLLITALGLTSICTKATAQKDTSSAGVYKIWDDLLLKTKKDIKANTLNSFIHADPRLNATTEQWVSGISKTISAKPATEPWKEWTSASQRPSGDINLLPLMDEVPAPLYILPIAGQADIDAKFDPYLKKIESQQKQLAETVSKNNKLQQVYQKEGEEGVKKRAMAESDKNIMIQQMGGTEKLMNMSDAERKAAALKMASDVKSNPGMLAGNNPAMSAMMQKVMTDKDYAKRFNKMSDAEKEAEVRKFMAENLQQQDPNFDLDKKNQQHEKLTTEKNNIKYSQDITLLGMRVQKRLEAATELYSKNVSAINDWVKVSERKLAGGTAQNMKPFL